MKNKHLFIAILSTLLVALIVFGGCFRPAAPPEVAPPAAPPEAPPEAVKTVNVAMVTALSGPAAMWGLPGITGVGILLDDVNAAGGLRVGPGPYIAARLLQITLR